MAPTAPLIEPPDPLNVPGEVKKSSEEISTDDMAPAQGKERGAEPKER